MLSTAPAERGPDRCARGCLPRAITSPAAATAGPMTWRDSGAGQRMARPHLFMGTDTGDEDRGSRLEWRAAGRQLPDA